MADYDYCVVGAGLFGATFAYEATKAGKKVLVVEKRNHIGGNIYTKKTAGIHTHIYGAHIFHTNSKEVWDYICQFAEFNRFTNSPVANYRGEIYSLPFNMYTFNRLWGVVTPEEAHAHIEAQRKAYFRSARTKVPSNLEEQAISLVGMDIYKKLIQGYSEKQWGRACTELPPEIIRRIPVRFTYDNNYFDALYQGIPTEGYTKIISKMLSGAEVCLNMDYLLHRLELNASADTVLYTGPIDAYFDFRLGRLQYRSLRFEVELLNMPNRQGNAVVNYTDRETPYTRVIEHKWFTFGKDDFGNLLEQSVISREYPLEWTPGDEPYYPINNRRNHDLYQEYRRLADVEPDVIFGGRLGTYSYLNMDQTIAHALKISRKILDGSL